MSDLDDAIFTSIFAGEGAVGLSWEVASRCPCYSTDTKQPQWDCPQCTGYGVIFAAKQTVYGLFRSQSRWLSFRSEGELDHGEASLTTAMTAKPGYTDRRVRDRYTTLSVADDVAPGRVFYPAAPAVPFIFNNAQRAWRVQLQSATQQDRVVPQ